VGLFNRHDFGFGRLPVTHRAKLCGDSNPSVKKAERRVRETRFVKAKIENSGMCGWWAVYTKHQHEKVATDLLTAKGLEVFLPQYKSTRSWKDRKKVISLPLFPSYIFVRPGNRFQVVSTPGVFMIVGRGERDAVVPELEIEAIRRTLEGHFSVEPHPFLKCGERVRVTRGSLEGLQGILVRIRNIHRLILSVDMLAQSIAVEVNASDVEPAMASCYLPLPASSMIPAFPQALKLAKPAAGIA
jgi:transcription antitermination factor NusG